jgi:hypothetical protein
MHRGAKAARCEATAAAPFHEHRRAVPAQPGPRTHEPGRIPAPCPRQTEACQLMKHHTRPIAKPLAM